MQTGETVPRVKGPRVWLDMDQQEIDNAYDQAVWAPNREIVLARRRAMSAQTLARIGRPLRLPYGATEIEQLDIYRTTRPHAPIQIFIHGGGWRTTRAADYALLGEIFVRAGAHVVIPDFAPVTDHGGDLRPMVEDLLSAERVRRRGLFDYAEVRRIIDDNLAGREDNSLKVYQLLTLELWHEAFLGGR